MRWKNARPHNNEAYVPTDAEHVANILTHGVSRGGSCALKSSSWYMLLALQLCLPLVLSWVRDMLSRASTSLERRAAVTYGCALMGLAMTSLHICAVQHYKSTRP